MMQMAQNASQHTPEGSVIRLGSRIEDGNVVLWVHDSGQGVAPEDADRVFERYVRGSNRPAGSGLGLGLSIVAAIASAHGGHARIADSGGEGARFEIVIPAVIVGPSSNMLASRLSRARSDPLEDALAEAQNTQSTGTPVDSLTAARNSDQAKGLVK